MATILTSRGLTTALVAVAFVTACDEGPAGPPEGVQTIEWVALGDQTAPFYIGAPVAFRVRALDYAGEPMAGELLRFVALHETSLSATEVLTDALGEAEVEMRAVGPRFGLRVEADGSADPLILELDAEPPPEVRFDFDQARLESPGEEFSFFAQVLDEEGELMGGSSVTFELAPQGIVTLTSPGTYTGTTSGMRVAVRAEAPGEVMLIATHRSGAADTAHIVVNW